MAEQKKYADIPLKIIIFYIDDNYMNLNYSGKNDFRKSFLINNYSLKFL